MNASATRGRLFVVSAPSGAGKTSLVRALLASSPNLTFSISYTTRRARESEREGHDYYFVDRETFRRKAEDGELLEWAEVFDNHYGTGRPEVERELTRGRSVILEIDWQGARQVRSRMPECVSIFILPPSRAELERRLRDRGTDSEAVIARRLRDAVADMSHWNEFDYVVVNDDFARGLEALAAIVAGRGETERADRIDLPPRVAELLGSTRQR